MAHFAELDENNVVIRVLVVNNDIIQKDGVEIESLGVEFCQNLFGGNWIQTSYNSNFRKRYAQPGYTYNPSLNMFIDPQPYPSWSILGDDGCWQPPTPKPSEKPNLGYVWVWDESTLSWVSAKINHPKANSAPA